jgi:hypothetical protein
MRDIELIFDSLAIEEKNIVLCPRNSATIPFSHTGEIALRVHLDTNEKIIIKGRHAVLTLIGEAIYVEKFPG